MLSVNMSQMKKWVVDTDNVRYYDNIMKTRGKVLTLDYAGYVHYLDEFAIFYTLTH